MPTTRSYTAPTIVEIGTLHELTLVLPGDTKDLTGSDGERFLGQNLGPVS